MHDPDIIAANFGYKLESNKEMRGFYGSAYFLEGGKVLKITSHKEEIAAAKLLVGKKSTYLADVYEVHDLLGYSVIILERLDKLPHQVRQSWRKYQNFYRLYFIVNIFYRLFRALLFQKPRNMSLKWFIKRVSNENAEKWRIIDENISSEAIKHGIYHPKDYLALENMGIKGKNVASFDVLLIDDKKIY